MTTPPKISIIVPVYNAEKYLERCIGSIIKQTYENFELILVDDGSSDSSSKICDDFCSRDNRITVIHKSNAGVSSARNEGLSKAQGEFICFIDADDKVSQTYLLNLITNEADLCVSGVTINHPDGKTEKIIPSKTIVGNIDTNKTLVVELIIRRLLDGPCQKLFKRKIIENATLKFDTRLSLGEDTIFVLNYLLRVKTMAVISSSDYTYDLHPGESLTHRRDKFESAIYFSLQMKSLLSQIRTQLKINCNLFDKYIQNRFLTFLFVALFTLYYTSYKRSERIKQLYIIREILNNHKIPINCNGITAKNNIVHCMIKFTPIYLVDLIFNTSIVLKK